MRFATEHQRGAQLHYVLHSCGHTLTYDDSNRGILDDLRLHRMSLRPCTYCDRGWGLEAVSLEDDCGAKPFAERIRGRLLPAVDDLIDRMADKLAEDWPIDVTGLAQRACLGRIHRDVLFQSSAMWRLGTPLAAGALDNPTRLGFVQAYFDLPARIRLLELTELMDLDTGERWYEYTVLLPYPETDDDWSASDRWRRLRVPWPVEGVAERVYSQLAEGGPQAVMPFLNSHVPWVRRCALDVLGRVG